MLRGDGGLAGVGGRADTGRATEKVRWTGKETEQIWDRTVEMGDSTGGRPRPVMHCKPGLVCLDSRTQPQVDLATARWRPCKNDFMVLSRPQGQDELWWPAGGLPAAAD